MKKVAIIQTRVPHYRIPFFNKLKELLREDNIELILIYGHGNKEQIKKNDEMQIDWGLKINNKFIKIGPYEVCWQPISGLLENIDLVIVEQNTKLLVNYFLMFQSKFRLRRIALWGHGKNYISHKDNYIKNKLKSLLSINSNWWFAYTNRSVEDVKSFGFPPNRITNIENAIDTKEQYEAYKTLSSLENLKIKHGISGENVCIYCGSLYKQKHIKFLIESCKIVQKHIPDFELIIIGDGPDKQLVRNAQMQNKWIHYFGTAFNHEKAEYFKLSKLFLNPGLVGLGILDSFVMETPIITTYLPYHSPEIEYLKNHINGVIVDHNVYIYATTILEYLRKNEKITNLIDGCQNSSENYTVENMAQNFREGILKAISNVN